MLWRMIMQTILIVDDEQGVTKAMRRTLQGEGYRILEAESGLEGLAILKEEPVHVVLSDQRMPGMSGAMFLSFVRQTYPNTVRMIMSGYCDFSDLTAAVNGGTIYKFLGKPWHNDDIRRDIRNAFLAQSKLAKDKCLGEFYDITPEAMIILDHDGHVVSISSGCSEKFGFDSTEFKGQDFLGTHCILTDEELNNIYQKLDTTSWEGDVFVMHGNGNYLQCSISISLRKNGCEQKSYLIVLRESNTLNLNNLVNTLPRRESLMIKIDTAIQDQSPPAEYALISIALPQLTELSTKIGHKATTELFDESGLRLLNSISSEGILGEINEFSFCLWIGNINKPSILNEYITNIVEAFKKPISISTHDITLDVHMGVVVSSGLKPTQIEPTEMDHFKVECAETLLRYAETARNEIVLPGSQHQFYLTEMTTKLDRNWVIERDLSRAIELNQFCLDYQPKVDMDTGRLYGAEALLRWQHPELGLLSPSEFVPIAEKNRSIITIGAWMLNEACQQAKTWHVLGRDDLVVSVNLSTLQLCDQSISDVVESTLESLNFPPDKLELELTESFILSDKPQAQATMSYLNHLGVKFAVDDFGTGFLSLEDIKLFPFHALKIDQSFVFGVTNNEMDSLLVANMISLAKTTGLNIIAEGIETEEQYQRLKSMGCNLGQGFFIGYAVNELEFMDIVNETMTQLHYGGTK